MKRLFKKENMKEKEVSITKKNRGFTLIEIIVVLAIIALLAAILVPLVTKYVEDAKIGRVKNEVQVIGAAILNFNKDTGNWPVFSGATGGLKAANATIKVLVSPASTVGDVPGPAEPGESISGWFVTGASQDDLRNHLERNTLKTGTYPTSGEFGWRGPYHSDFKPDTWGNQYYINIEWLQPGATKNAVLVLSAGPDETIDTSYTQTAAGTVTISNDDIAYRIR